MSSNNYAADEMVKEFGIEVRSELTTIEARVLQPPMVIPWAMFLVHSWIIKALISCVFSICIVIGLAAKVS